MRHHSHGKLWPRVDRAREGGEQLISSLRTTNFLTLFSIFLTLLGFIGASGTATFGRLPEETGIPPGLVFLALLIPLALAVMVVVQQDSKRPDFKMRPSALSELILGSIITLLPLSVIAGSLTGFLVVAAVPSEVIWDSWGTWSYEIGGFVLAVITISAIGIYRRAEVLVLIYSAGFATGISATIMLLRPEENSAGTTYVAWLALTVGAGIAIAFVVLLARYAPVERGLAAVVNFFITPRGRRGGG